MSFYICTQPKLEGKVFCGVNLDQVSTFEFTQDSKGLPLLFLKMRCGQTIRISDGDAVQILYAMGILAPTFKN